MRAIEMETVISQDGKLPVAFGEAFGRKVRVIILLTDEERPALEAQSTSSLMELAGQIKAFEGVVDPVGYQRELRDEWSESPWFEVARDGAQILRRGSHIRSLDLVPDMYRVFLQENFLAISICPRRATGV